MNFEYEIMGLTFHSRLELAVSLLFVCLIAKLLTVAVFKIFLMRGKGNAVH